MSRYMILTFCGAALALAAAGAAAQNAAPPAAGTPNAVGVTPSEAADAVRKAVPRSDTGTVVRTAPSPVDQARSAAQNGTTSAAGNGRSAGGTLESADTATTAPGAAGAPAAATATPGPSVDTPPIPAPRRSPRADRN